MKPTLKTIAIVIATAMLYSCAEKNTDKKQLSLNESENGKYLVYNLKEFDDKKARFYEYKFNDITIKYFIVKSSDNVVRVAFDACDVCWRSGLGYSQKNDLMICNNCGRQFPTKSVNVVKGGCNPSPINRKVREGKLYILKEDIEAGSWLFNFKG